MSKYRILKTTKANGEATYTPQIRLFYFWWVSSRTGANSEEQALAIIKDFEVMKTEHIKVDLDE